MNAILLNNKKRPKGLPAEYTEVEWIKSTGTQYIDTGYTPNNNTRVVCTISYNEISNSTSIAFGAAVAYNDRAFESYIYNSKAEFNFNSSYKYGSVNLSANTIYKIDADKNVFKLYNSSDTLIETLTTTDSTFTAPYTLFLFGLHRPTIAYGKTAIYGHVYIYDNDVLASELVPCVRNSDNVAGMYDLVQKEFRTNGGTGTFVFGPYVMPEVPSEYQRVEYIEGTGTQYINLTQTTPAKFNWDADVMISSANGVLFGGYIFNGSYQVYLELWNKWYYPGYTSSYIAYNGSQSTRYRYYYRWNGSSYDTGRDGISGTTTLESVENAQIAIFSFINADGTTRTGSNIAKAKIYSLRFFSQGTLWKWFVPCYRISDGVIGLYDVVEKHFYTNDGTGTFTKGPDA